ncbi:MAG: GNAT family N-acetyltransferase [Bdellovibrionales bacterium]|jgi:CelD/BcsL family acetyltransferase involved in cellulose biosynthesis
MLTCQVLTSEQEVEALAQAWRALQERLGKAPFTGYDWAMAWWRTIGKPSGAALMVVAGFEETGRLVGLLPFSIRRKHGVRVLRLMGHEVYYYRNFLIESESDVPLMWQTALKQTCYDFADIKNIHEATPEKAFLDCFAIFLEKSHVYHQEHKGEDRQKILGRYSKGFRHKIRRITKYIEEKQGALEVFRTQNNPPVEVIDFLIQRKKMWVKEKGKRGIFHDDNVSSFYHEMVRVVEQNKALSLFWMVYQGEIVAALFSVVGGNVVYGHTLTIDYSAAHFMPGLFLNVEAIVWGSEHGYAEFNMMEGEEPHKARLAFQNRTIFEYVYTRTIMGKAYLCLYQLLRALRAIKQKKLNRVQAKD